MGNLLFSEAEKEQLLKELATNSQIQSNFRQIHFENSIKTKFHRPLPQENKKTKIQINNFIGEAAGDQLNGGNVFSAKINDRRKRIDSEMISKWPYSSIGVIQVEASPKNWFGTGTLIYPNIVLTCAHNVYRSDFEISKIEFIPCIEGKIYSEKATVKEVYIPDEFKADIGNSLENYALLILDRQMGINFGHMGLYVSEFYMIRDRMINLCGYAGDETKTDNMGNRLHFMWSMEGHVSLNKEKSLLESSQFFTNAGGLCGSPVFFGDEVNGFYIVGIHISSQNGTDSALYLTEERFLQLEKWIVENSTKDFSFLQNLNLSYKDVSDEGLRLLCSSNLTSLQDLDLSWNSLTLYGIESLGKAMFTGLQKLDLSYNKIGDLGAEYLSKAPFAGLQNLYLDCIGIGEMGAWHISKGLYTNLLSLKMGYNKLGEKGTWYVSKANLPLLQSLYLNDCYIYDKGCEYLSLSVFSRLNLLNIDSNNITETGALSLSKAVFSGLQILEIRKNYLGDKGVEYLSNSVFNRLTNLSLVDNNIYQQGAEHISKGVFSRLISLDLNYNYVGDKGVEYLSKGVFPKLLNMNLENNNVGDLGCEFLSKGIFINLQSLNLSYNCITEKGVYFLSKANFSRLLSLNLLGNYHGDRGAYYLSKGNLTNLQNLYLSSNSIEKKGTILSTLKLK